jgi:hypothetical protein
MIMGGDFFLFFGVYFLNQVDKRFIFTIFFCNISAEFLFEVKKIFALKGQHKPARRNAAG